MLDLETCETDFRGTFIFLERILSDKNHIGLRKQVFNTCHFLYNICLVACVLARLIWYDTIILDADTFYFCFSRFHENIYYYFLTVYIETLEFKY